jgi:hypothetical protein
VALSELWAVRNVYNLCRMNGLTENKSPSPHQVFAMGHNGFSETRSHSFLASVAILVVISI